MNAEPSESRSTSAYDVLLNYDVPSVKKQQTTEAHDIVEGAYDKKPAQSSTGAAYNLGSYAYKTAKAPETPSLDYSKYEVKESVDKFPTGALDPKPILNIPVRPVEFSKPTEEVAPSQKDDLSLILDEVISSQKDAAPAEEPVKEPVKELAEEPASEPAKEPAKEPAEEKTAEPVAEPAQKSENTQPSEAEPKAEPKTEPKAEPKAEPKTELKVEQKSEQEQKQEQEALAAAGKIIEHLNELRDQGIYKEKAYQRAIKKTFEIFEKLSGWEKWWSGMSPAERRAVKATNEALLTSQPEGTKSGEFSYWLISKEVSHPEDFMDVKSQESEKDIAA